MHMHAGTGVNKQVLMTRLLEGWVITRRYRSQEEFPSIIIYTSRLMLRQVAIHVYNFNRL